MNRGLGHLVLNRSLPVHRVIFVQELSLIDVGESLHVESLLVGTGEGRQLAVGSHSHRELEVKSAGRVHDKASLLIDYHGVIQLAEVRKSPRGVSVYLHATTGAGESASGVIDRAIVLSGVHSFISLTAIARTRSLSEAVLTSSRSKAGIPALEILSSVVRAHLDGHLRRLGGEF